MKKLIFVFLLVIGFYACTQEMSKTDAINTKDPNAENVKKVKPTYGMTSEFRGKIYNDYRNNIHIYSISDERTGKKYLLFSDGQGLCVIEDKPKDLGDTEYENR